MNINNLLHGVQMEKINAQFNHPEYEDEAINTSLTHLLSNNSLCAMASISGNIAHINTAYFVYDSNLSLYFLSQPTDMHSANITQNSSVAIAIWSQSKQWGEDLQGVQLFGTCKQIGLGKQLISAMKLFLTRFPAFKAIMKHPGEFADGVPSRMYAVEVSSLKLLDEPQFGRRNYIELKVV